MKILASGHDAGGTNHLLARNYRGEVTFILTGPGSEIAKKRGIPHLSEFRISDIQLFDLVVVSSNAQHQLSDDILDSALTSKIPTVGVLEHWVNYSTRWVKNPNTIEVADIHAFIGAFLSFRFKVRLRRNQYLLELKNEFAGMQTSGSGLLLIAQPLSEKINHKKGNCFCNAVENLLTRVKTDSNLILREHFATNLSECARYLEFKTGLNIRISYPDSSLALDLSACKYVLGIDSYALYISRRLGRKVFSINHKRRSWFAPRYTNLE